MANTIITKNSSTASAVPTSGDLVQGELAVNVTDKRLFTEDSGGNVVEVGTNPSTMAVAGNATVGGTLGVTGVATLTANPVLSGGTANGVPYLNGSKVLTSGSALTFDGTLFKVAGYADFSTSNTLCRISSNATSIFIGDNSIGAGSGYGIGSSSAYLYFQAYGTEQMRLTTTGLGIGTSSPANKLVVNVGTGATNGLYIYGTGGSVPTIYLGHDASHGTDATIASNGSTGNLEIAPRSGYDTYIKSGNLGLGVTPSASTSGTYKGLYVGHTLVKGAPSAATASFASNCDIANNYIYTGYASKYEQGVGAHYWYTAPSGTAGNAISFTQAMTLDASGNLFVGQSSLPTGWSGITRSVSLKQGNASIVGFLANAYNSDRGIYMGHDGTIGAIGVSYGASGGYSPLTFWTSDTERARIDSSGNLLVGTTSAPNGTSVYGSGFVVEGNDRRALYLASSSTTSGIGLVRFYNPNGPVGTITTSASSTSYNTSSDYRLKNTIAPMTGALAKVAALKPCTYKWNADGSDGEGFIAHELAEVCPDAVSGEKDAVDAEGNPVYQGIDTSFLVATLTAAIQEQQAIIDSLKARLDAANL